MTGQFLAERLALWGVDRPPARPEMLLDFIERLGARNLIRRRRTAGPSWRRAAAPSETRAPIAGSRRPGPNGRR